MAGIQVKAGNLKFGLPEVVFHNYTISKERTSPKAVNVCAFICQNDRTEGHAPSQSILRMMSAIKPVH